MNSSWQNVLLKELEKPYFLQLMKNVDSEYEKHTCFPPKELIFNAFDLCTFDNLKIVIIGQDPYHGTGEANGLCFSVNDNVKIPPSLRNIFAEINTDLDRIMLPTSGNLEHWAKQGVLLLNATLTVRKDEANSHKHLDWQKFTNAIIHKISEEKKHVVFMLWGSFAQKKIKFIDESKHFILQSGHPSPLSANRGFWFGNKHFSKSNDFLIKNKKTPITW
jgi:uracil-DNA glycosylase